MGLGSKNICQLFGEITEEVGIFWKHKKALNNWILNFTFNLFDWGKTSGNSQIRQYFMETYIKFDVFLNQNIRENIFLVNIKNVIKKMYSNEKKLFMNISHIYDSFGCFWLICRVCYEMRVYFMRNTIFIHKLE